MGMTVERAIKNAAASVEMEGFTISPETLELCRQLLERQISYEEYKCAVLENAGVLAK